MPEKLRTWINDVWTLTELWKGTEEDPSGQPRAGSSPPTSQVLQPLASPVSKAQEFFRIDLSRFSSFPPSACLTCSTQTSQLFLWQPQSLEDCLQPEQFPPAASLSQQGGAKKGVRSVGGKAATGSLWHQEQSFYLHTFWRKAIATFCLLMRNVMPGVMSLTSQSCSLSGGSSQLHPSLLRPFFCHCKFWSSWKKGMESKHILSTYCVPDTMLYVQHGPS